MPVVKALALGALGGALFRTLELPLAWMLGSLTLTALGGRLLAPIRVPRMMRDGFVPVLGVLLGSAFTPAVLDQMSRWPSGLAVIALYVIASGVLGTLYFRRVARLDPVTAFFAALPGGLSDLTLVGAALGANLGHLAIIHSMRVVVVVVTIPLALSLLAGSGPLTPSGPVAEHAALDLTGGATLFFCAVAGWGLGRLVRMPAAPVIGPLLVSAAVHLAGLTDVAPPGWLIVVVQIVLGAYIGSRLSEMDLVAIRHALLHGIAWGSVLVAAALAISGLASRLLPDIPFASMLLGAAPGGLPEMAVLTLALGVDVAFVTTCHLVRLLAVYFMTPAAMALGGWKKPVSPEE